MADPQPYTPTAPHATGSATNSFGNSTQAQVPLSQPIFAGYEHHTTTNVVDLPGGTAPFDTNGEVVRGAPRFLTIAQFLSAFDTMDREKFLHLRNLLMAAGVVPDNADAATVRNGFAGVLSDVAAMTANNVAMSPMGYIKNLVEMNGYDPSKIGNSADFSLSNASGPPENGTTTQVNRQITDFTEGQAWSVLQRTVSEMLGRDPSDQELRDFTYRMNQLAATNPAVSKTITRYKDGEQVGTRTHYDPGFTADDAAQAAYEDAQNNPHYAEYHGAADVFNWAMTALGEIGG